MDATLTLPGGLRDELLVYAREAFPEEACGLLLGRGPRPGEAVEVHRCEAVRPARNLHPAAASRFLIDPLEYRRAEAHCAKHRSGLRRVLGFWHSHAGAPAQPSPVDLENARGLFESFPVRYLYLIVSLGHPDGEFACWRLCAAGREFEDVELLPQ